MRNLKHPKRMILVLMSLFAVAMIYFVLVGAECGSSSPTPTPPGGEPVVRILQDWPYDLVDSSKHLDWDANQSKYESYIIRAANKWNAYKPGVLRPDSASVVQDVRIVDVNKPEATWDGNCDRLLADIHMNAAKLDKYTDTEHILTTALHELGHALGLADNDNTILNVMYPYNYGMIAFWIDDEASYDAAYARY